MGENMCKDISKNLSGKYSKSATDAFTTASKGAI